MKMVKGCEVRWLNLKLILTKLNLERNPHDAKESSKERENFSLNSSIFSTVFSVNCICTNFSFHLAASEALLIDEL